MAFWHNSSFSQDLNRSNLKKRNSSQLNNLRKIPLLLFNSLGFEYHNVTHKKKDAKVNQVVIKRSPQVYLKTIRVRA